MEDRKGLDSEIQKRCHHNKTNQRQWVHTHSLLGLLSTDGQTPINQKYPFYNLLNRGQISFISDHTFQEVKVHHVNHVTSTPTWVFINVCFIKKCCFFLILETIFGFKRSLKLNASRKMRIEVSHVFLY